MVVARCIGPRLARSSGIRRGSVVAPLHRPIAARGRYGLAMADVNTSDWAGWLFLGGDWYDRRQRRQLQEVAASSQERVRGLARRLDDQNASLEEQVDQLREAVVRIAELEDARDELRNFGEIADLRQWARQHLPRLGRTDAPPPPLPDDVPTSWLHPALAAAVAETEGRSGTARRLLDEAIRRERDTAAAFAIGMGAAREWPDWVDVGQSVPAPLDDAVDEFDEARWFALATGGVGRNPQVRELRRWLAALPEDADLPPADDIAGTDLPIDRDTLVRDAVVDATQVDPSEPAVEALAPLVASIDTASALPDDHGRLGGPADHQAAGVRLAQLAVDEPSPGERAVLDRMAQSRSAISMLDDIDAPPEDIDVHTFLVERLVRDEPKASRRTAAALLADALRAMNLDTGHPGPEPTSTVEVAGLDIELPDAGLPLGWTERVTEHVAAQHPTARWTIPVLVLGVVIAIGGVAVVATVGPVGWALVGLGVVTALGAAIRRRRDTSSRAAAVERAVDEGRRAVDDQRVAVDQWRLAYAAHVRRRDEVAPMAGAELDKIEDSVLGPVDS